MESGRAEKEELTERQTGVRSLGASWAMERSLLFILSVGGFEQGVDMI